MEGRNDAYCYNKFGDSDSSSKKTVANEISFLWHGKMILFIFIILENGQCCKWKKKLEAIMEEGCISRA